ncbi:MFS general substrate transporter [Auriculariales sp. MPI-PUGE-AT-0066]|nr:MFS general substrate transporter [Auriculariales sp. MPI-PUGE-AT-0066]
MASASTHTLAIMTVHDVPFVNRLLAHVGGAAALFLATTDATLVATALPTIASDLKINSTDYTWISVIYLLFQTILQPVFGHAADTLGRKTILITSVLGFMLGSIITALSQNLNVLLLGRAISGAAAGGIVSSVWTVLTEVVEPSKRSVWSTALSCTWCASAVAGPLLGGAFAGTSGDGFLSWRVAFWINVPICLVVLPLVLVSLRRFDFHRRAPESTWKAVYHKFRDTFDFIGLILLMGGTACLLLGFSRSSSTGWNNRVTIALIAVGVPLLIGALVYETRTRRDALIAPSLFYSTTACIVFASSFFITFAFNAATFYLAVFAQARGATPLEAGYWLLPLSLGSSFISIPTAVAIHWAQKRTTQTTLPPKVAYVLGLGLAAVGFGLLIRLDVESNATERIVYPLIAGLGIGMTFHSPFQLLSSTIEDYQLASATGAFFLVRFIATTVGVSTAGVIFTSQLAHRLPVGFDVDAVVSDLRGLISIPDPALRRLVLEATCQALSVIWIVCCPLVAVAFLTAICIRVRAIQTPADCARSDTSSTPARADSPSGSSSADSDDTIIVPDIEKGVFRSPADPDKDDTSSAAKQ